MRNFDFTQLSVMNCKDLEQIQNMIQIELNAKNQKIAELKNTICESIHKITELSGSSDVIDEIVLMVKPSQAECRDEHRIEESSKNSGHTPEVEEPVIPEPDEANEDDDLIPPFYALEGKEVCLEDEPDPFEYRNEEEYELVKMRSKKLQPLDSLLKRDIAPKIAMLGYNVPEDTPFRQNCRVIDSLGGGGNTLTTEFSPWLYIPDMKECA